MKRKYLTVLFVFVILHGQAQNVGIGTNTPSEKLDVHGNVNITGTIKTNGKAGINGQVLMNTGAGVGWGTIGSNNSYKHCQMFYTAGSGTFTLPAGVTEMTVEAWGAGGGGNYNCGGTSGSYARFTTAIDTSSVTTIDYIIGEGGTGGGNSASNPGGDSYVFAPDGTFRAIGGGGITFNGTTTYGTGINYMNSPASFPAFYMPGNRGSVTYSTFGQSDASTYVRTTYTGSGGAPIGLPNSSADMGPVYNSVNGIASTSVLTYSPTGTKPTLPSAGGGGARSGADGMVIFWWN